MLRLQHLGNFINLMDFLGLMRQLPSAVSPRPSEEEVALESPTAEVYTYYFLDQEMNEMLPSSMA